MSSMIRLKAIDLVPAHASTARANMKDFSDTNSKLSRRVRPAPQQPETSMEPCMNALRLVCPALLAALLCGPASAESLRCSRGIASEGDSRLSILYKCGPPVLKDSFCAPVFTTLSLQPVPEPFASAYVPCLQTEEWLYERGPGNLLATVTLRSGVVRSIAYGREPQ